MKGRNAQISVFIIIALALLLVVTVGIIIYNSTLDEEAKEFVQPTIANSPVQKFIEMCIERQTIEAVNRLGAHGGYIYVPDRVQADPRFGISAHPTRQAVVPVWFIGRQSLVPTISSMEEQMGQYISQTLPSCLQDFTFISDFAQIEEISQPNATVRILNEQIVVDLDYELWTNTGSISRSMEEFTYVYDMELKGMIESAQSFAQELRGRVFLEELTVDLMSIADPKIPMSNIKFTCEKPIWFENDVKQTLEEILYYNIPRVQVRGAETRNFEAPIDEYEALNNIHPDDFIGGSPYGDKANLPSDTFEYAHMYFRSGQAGKFFANDIKISMRYLPEFGLRMNVRPSSNGKMETANTQGKGNFMSFFCMYVYHFTYDVDYPVEVVFVKERAHEDGSDFHLRFAIPVTLDHNLPDQTNDLTNFLLVDAQPNEVLCNDVGDQSVTILARDAVTGFDIPEFNAEYQCYTHLCPLGDTSIEGGRSLVRTAFPQGCYGGLLRVTADDYVSEEIKILEPQQTYELELLPLTKVSYTVLLGPNQAGILATPLRDNQYAIVTLTDQNSDYETYATYGEGQELAIEIIEGPAVYNMTLLVYDGNDFAGGYFGELAVDGFNFGSELYLYAKEFVPYPRGEELGEAWRYLQENTTYQGRYQPTWN